MNGLVMQPKLLQVREKLLEEKAPPEPPEFELVFKSTATTAATSAATTTAPPRGGLVRKLRAFLRI